MKHFLLFFLLISPILIYAQDDLLILRPDSNEMSVDPTVFETVAHAYLINNSDEEITVRWERTIEYQPDDWLVAICDKEACYSPVVDSEEFTLAPGDSSNMDVHIQPRDIGGEAKINLLIYNIEDPEISVRGTYVFESTTTPVLDYNEIELNLYPNPASEYFMLSNYDNVSYVEVSNLGGKQVLAFAASPDKKFGIDALPRGLYLVRLLDQQRKNIKTVRLVKR